MNKGLKEKSQHILNSLEDIRSQPEDVFFFKDPMISATYLSKAGVRKNEDILVQGCG